MLRQGYPPSRLGTLQVVRIHSREEAIQTWDGGDLLELGQASIRQKVEYCSTIQGAATKGAIQTRRPEYLLSENLNDSVSESGGTLVKSFWARLLPVWEADRFLLAVP